MSTTKGNSDLLHSDVMHFILTDTNTAGRNTHFVHAEVNAIHYTVKNICLSSLRMFHILTHRLLVYP